MMKEPFFCVASGEIYLLSLLNLSCLSVSEYGADRLLTTPANSYKVDVCTCLLLCCSPKRSANESSLVKLSANGGLHADCTAFSLFFNSLLVIL